MCLRSSVLREDWKLLRSPKEPDRFISASAFIPLCRRVNSIIMAQHASRAVLMCSSLICEDSSYFTIKDTAMKDLTERERNLDDSAYRLVSFIYILPDWHFCITDHCDHWGHIDSLAHWSAFCASCALRSPSPSAHIWQPERWRQKRVICKGKFFIFF